jgi:tetratricopeptide (TPR) repeat protein
VRAAALLLALTLAAVSAPVPATAQPGASLTREQAREALARGDAAARRRAAAALGDLGTMADAPALLDALRDDDEDVRETAEGSLWQVWSRSGDPAIDALFQTGVEQMARGDTTGAIQTFTAIIQARPDFAEGWNKRATIYFLVGEYDRSLRDCAEVVKRNPQHWGVLAGYGQIYLRLGKPELALEYFQRALDVNPNLSRVRAAVEDLRRAIIEKRRGTI